MAGTLASDIQTLVGRQLGAVTFVQDYWQLAFDGPVLTIFTRTTIQSPESSVSIDHPNFRNQLCGCIGKIVRSADFNEDQCLVLGFDNEIKIEISVHQCDYVGPEALIFDNGVAGAPLYVF